MVVRRAGQPGWLAAGAGFPSHAAGQGIPALDLVRIAVSSWAEQGRRARQGLGDRAVLAYDGEVGQSVRWTPSPFLRKPAQRARPRDYHPRLPVTVEAIVEEAVDAVAAGAAELHLHVRGPDGAESLAPAAVDATVAALRAGCRAP